MASFLNKAYPVKPNTLLPLIAFFNLSLNIQIKFQELVVID